MACTINCHEIWRLNTTAIYWARCFAQSGQQVVIVFYRRLKPGIFTVLCLFICGFRGCHFFLKKKSIWFRVILHKFVRISSFMTSKSSNDSNNSQYLCFIDRKLFYLLVKFTMLVIPPNEPANKSFSSMRKKFLGIIALHGRSEHGYKTNYSQQKQEKRMNYVRESSPLWFILFTFNNKMQ